MATGEWIRPITIFGKGRSDPEAFYEDDLKKFLNNPLGPKLLDCVKIGFGSSCAKNCQPENMFVDGKPWMKVSSYPRNQLSKITDVSKKCFLGKTDPYNDRIPIEDVKKTPLNSSLNLIKMNRERNHVTLSHSIKTDGTYKHKMSFLYDEKTYRMSVTDSYYETVYQQTKINDAVVFDDFFMTIGVGADEFPPDSVIRHHYRLIVAIIPSNEIKEYSL